MATAGTPEFYANQAGGSGFIPYLQPIKSKNERCDSGEGAPRQIMKGTGLVLVSFAAFLDHLSDQKAFCRVTCEENSDVASYPTVASRLRQKNLRVPNPQNAQFFSLQESPMAMFIQFLYGEQYLSPGEALEDSVQAQTSTLLLQLNIFEPQAESVLSILRQRAVQQISKPREPVDCMPVLQSNRSLGLGNYKLGFIGVFAEPDDDPTGGASARMSLNETSDGHQHDSSVHVESAQSHDLRQTGLLDQACGGEIGWIKELLLQPDPLMFDGSIDMNQIPPNQMPKAMGGQLDVDVERFVVALVSQSAFASLMKELGVEGYN